MSKEIMRVWGGHRLSGTVEISGGKNAASAILLAASMSSEKCVVENLPLIDDVEVIAGLLRSIGARVEQSGRSMIFRLRAADWTGTMDFVFAILMKIRIPWMQVHAFRIVVVPMV